MGDFSGCTPIVNFHPAQKSENMVLFSDLLHLAVNLSPGISSIGAVASGSALVGRDARALPPFASDIALLHRTVKRALSVVEDKGSPVQVPQPELLDILSKLKELEVQVVALLPAGAEDGKSSDIDDHKCDVEHLLFSLGVNGTHNKRGQVSDHPFFNRSANCSMEAIAAAQRQDVSLNSPATTSDKMDISSSSPSKNNKEANEATESTAAGHVRPATSLDGIVALVSPTPLLAATAGESASSATDEEESTSADPKTPDVDNEFQTTTLTKTKTSRITITITRKHTVTQPRTTPIELSIETKVLDSDQPKPAQASTDAKDTDDAAENSILRSVFEMSPSPSMNATVSVEDQQTFFNSTVKTLPAGVDAEPRLSVARTETSATVGSEVTATLLSENLTQLPHVEAAARLSALSAPPSGFKTVSTRAASGVARSATSSATISATSSATRSATRSATSGAAETTQ